MSADRPANPLELPPFRHFVLTLTWGERGVLFRALQDRAVHLDAVGKRDEVEALWYLYHRMEQLPHG